MENVLSAHVAKIVILLRKQNACVILGRVENFDQKCDCRTKLINFDLRPLI